MKISNNYFNCLRSLWIWKLTCTEFRVLCTFLVYIQSVSWDTRSNLGSRYSIVTLKKLLLLASKSYSRAQVGKSAWCCILQYSYQVNIPFWDSSVIVISGLCSVLPEACPEVLSYCVVRNSWSQNLKSQLDMVNWLDANIIYWLLSNNLVFFLRQNFRL